MKRYLAIRNYSLVSPQTDPSWTDAVPPAMKRRDARIWQMAYAAAHRVIAGCGNSQPKAVIVGTALGALEETRQFLDGVFTDGLGSPRNFIASVHNSMAGKLALGFKIDGPNLTLCDSHNSFASALIAADLLNAGNFPALVCIVDERIPLLDEIQPHLSHRCLPFLVNKWEEAAVAFIVDGNPAGNDCKVRAFGPAPTERRNPESICRELIEKNVPGFTGTFMFNESSTSFIQPAISAATALKQGAGHSVIGSFSPTTGAVAIVEILQAS